MLSDEQLATIIEFGYEQRGVEFKGAGERTDKSFLANVARAALALSNQRDGGHVIVGLSEDGLEADKTGLTINQLEQWLSYDDVSDQINAYADPPLQINLRQGKLPNGRDVVVIEVSEFAEVPVLSKKDYPHKIAARQLYTRSMAKPQSSASLTQNELREVITLATEKQLARFLQTAQHAEIDLAQVRSVGAAVKFDAQVQRERDKGFHLDADLPQLTSVIRPEAFKATRLSFQALRPALESATVRRGGWPFPWVQNPTAGRDWIGEQMISMHAETWQLFGSGQFFDIRAIETFQPEHDGFYGGHEQVAGYLAIWWPLLRFTEIIEFASRLQRDNFASESVTIELALRNIDGFALVAAHPGRSGLHGIYKYGDDRWTYELKLSPDDGRISSRGPAIEATMDLLQRFNWRGVTRDLLEGLLDEAHGPELA